MKDVLKFSLVILMFAMLSSILLAQETQSKEDSAKTEKTTTCTLKVEGMSCGGCAAGIQQALLKVPGVTKAEVDFETGSAKVEYDPKKTDTKKIVAAKMIPGQSIALVKSDKKKPESKQN